MTTDTSSNTPAEAVTGDVPHTAVQRDRRGPRRGRKALIVVALVGSFFAGGVLFSHLHASAEDAAGPGWMHHMPWMGPHGPQGHHPDGPPPPPMTPEQQAAQGRDMLDHALTAVDATTDQKSKVLAIYDTAINSLKDAPVLVFQTRLQIATLLTAPTIDHDKLEQLRSPASPTSTMLPRSSSRRWATPATCSIRRSAPSWS